MKRVGGPSGPRNSVSEVLSPARVSKKRKKVGANICWSPAPQVHEFDAESPSSRRLELGRKCLVESDEIEDQVLIFELRARGLKVGETKTVGLRQRNLLRNQWMKEMQDELERKGVNAKGDHNELSERLELIEVFRRRAQIRLSRRENLPVEMSRRALKEELLKRRIRVSETNKRNMIEALEHALLKEDEEALIGDGYEFGRRFLSATDLIDAQDASDGELREALKLRGFTNIPRKKTEKVELLQEQVERELENKLRRALETELVLEMQRTGLMPDQESNPAALSSPPHSSPMKQKEPTTPKLGKRKRDAPDAPDPKTTEQNVRDLFDTIYSSGVWRHDYANSDTEQERMPDEPPPSPSSKRNSFSAMSCLLQ